MPKSKNTLTIDPEFSGLCPPLKPEEFNWLEQSIINDGCQEPITVWDGHNNVILDGHNRYRICLDNEVPFATRPRKLETRGDAINWIITNQLGRRNLSDEQKAFLRGKRYRAEQKEHGHRGPEKSGQNDQSLSTSQRIGAELGIAEATVRRDAKFADAVEKIGESAGPEAKQALLSGTLGLSKKDVQELAKLPADQQRAAIEGGREAVKTAVAEEPKSLPSNYCGTAIIRANEAVDALKRIPKNDPLRKRGFQIVTDWIKANR